MAILQTTIDTGIVEGIPGWNQAVTIFKGIPYAAPPVGELRWKAPQPAASWEGVRKCYNFGNIEHQKKLASEGGGNTTTEEFYCIDWPREEDCLYLNVWTPAKSTDEKLPVAVYFHGGGWAGGYGHLNCYDGEGFAKRGIVTVTINHRLGIFGFLAHPELTAEDEHGSSGNYGVMDLIASLKWVQRNIAAFGGDPDHVTVFGQSGGGFKVSSMMTSPLSQGLIHGAIMQSGGGITIGLKEIPLATAEQTGKNLLEFNGYKTIAEARQASQEDILSCVDKYNASDMPKGPRGILDFAPVIDGYVLPKSIPNMFLDGDFADIPSMIGCTRDEMYNARLQLPERDALVKEGERMFGEGKGETYVKALKYDEDREYALENYRRYHIMTGDMFAGAINYCRNQLKIGKKPGYQYLLTVVPPGADYSHHSAEHHYVFQTLLKSKRPYSGRDYDLSNQLADYWANFIKTGDPNGQGHAEWKPYTEETPQVMKLDYTCEMIDEPITDLLQLIIDQNLDYFTGK